MMSSYKLFESLAQATWERLQLSKILDCSQGETAITDFNLLEIARSNIPNIAVYKAKGKDEPQKGFDWEWWVGGNRIGWLRYSVQAKKLDLSSNRYNCLRRPVNQINLLENFARTHRSIPLYCFYNFIDESTARKSWNCSCLDFDELQLGCTIVPLHQVKPWHSSGQQKSFFSLHNKTSALPWRCLFCCPDRGNIVRNSFSPPDYEPRLYRQLPRSIRYKDLEIRNELVITELDGEYYWSEMEGYPKRIMVINTENENIL